MNDTTRDSAQLPPLQVDALAQTLFAAWQKTPHSEDDGEYSFKTLGEMSSTYSDAWRSVAREALRAQAASVEPVPVGYVHLVPDQISDQYDVRFWQPMAIGAKLYAGAPPAHIPADAGVFLPMESAPRDGTSFVWVRRITIVAAGKPVEYKFEATVMRRAWCHDEVGKPRTGEGYWMSQYISVPDLDARHGWWAPLPQAVAASSPATAVDAVDLHNEIMNIRAMDNSEIAKAHEHSNQVYAYKCGHRDARHAAAELATARESALVAERDQLRAMVEDVSTEVHLLRAALVYIAEESDDMVALKCAQAALAAPAVEGV